MRELFECTQKFERKTWNSTRTKEAAERRDGKWSCPWSRVLAFPDVNSTRNRRPVIVGTSGNTYMCPWLRCCRVYYVPTRSYIDKLWLTIRGPRYTRRTFGNSPRTLVHYLYHNGTKCCNAIHGFVRRYAYTQWDASRNTVLICRTKHYISDRQQS